MFFIKIHDYILLEQCYLVVRETHNVGLFQRYANFFELIGFINRFPEFLESFGSIECFDPYIDSYIKEIQIVYRVPVVSMGLEGVIVDLQHFNRRRTSKYVLCVV